MSGSVIDDLCRLTVATGKGRTDLSIPVRMTISELLPTLLRHVDPALVAQEGAADAWVLQRAGEQPLDPDGTPDSLGLLEGDVLYLRAPEAPMTPVHFDDLVDGVATAIRERPDRWRVPMTRQLYLTLSGATLAIAFLALLTAGPLLPRTLAAATLALLSVGAATVCSRAFDEAAAARAFGLAAVPLGGVAGFLLPGVLADAPADVPGLFGWAFGPVGGANALAAGACGAVFGLAAAIGTGLARPAFVASLATAIGIGLGGLVAVWSGISGAQAAGVVSVTALVCTLFGPMTAARLVGLRLPLLPETIEHLQEDIDPLPGDAVLTRAAAADRYLNALGVATGLLCSGAAVLLVRLDGWAPPTLVFLVGAALLLRSRLLVSAWQRLSAVLPGAVATASLLLMSASHADGWARAAVVLGVGVLAALLVFGARYLPGRRLRPFWGRWAEIAESMLALAAIPVLLQVVGLYGWARGLFG